MPSVHEKITKYGTTQIDYLDLIKRYPWIVEKGQNCILSPDSDGLLCGLFMSHYLNWNVKGFYDGKVLVIEKGFTAKDCIFLDIMSGNTIPDMTLHSSILSALYTC